MEALGAAICFADFIPSFDLAAGSGFNAGCSNPLILNSR